MAVGILGTGSYLPARVVTNVDLRELVPDADPEWVARKTMIEARRFAAPHEAASDLAANAARAALDRAGVVPDGVQTGPLRLLFLVPAARVDDCVRRLHEELV